MGRHAKPAAPVVVPLPGMPPGGQVGVRGRPRPLTRLQLAKYLELYSTGTSSSRAAALCGTTLWSISQRKRKDPIFAAAWEEASESFTGFLEDKAEGQAADCTLYSPTMLIFMLKARKPDVYRDN